MSDKSYKLMSIKEIYLKENSVLNKEEEKLILDLGNNKHINTDYRSFFLNENLNQSLFDYYNKFNKYGINSICGEIDKRIMKYDQDDKARVNGKYDQEFFELIKVIQKLKLKNELMKNLFPYFHKNKSRIIISCLDEEESNPILSIICGDKSQLNEWLKHFCWTGNNYEIHEIKFLKI